VHGVVTLDKDKRGRLLDLACPGGLFIFIVQPEILKTFLEHYSAHNSTSSMCNYIIQINKMLYYKVLGVLKYWECHSANIMDQLDHIGHGINHEQMQNKVAICCTYLSNNHRAWKRQLTGERYVALGEREKLYNMKLLDMASYHHTLEKLDEFLLTTYPKVLVHLRNRLSLYHVGNRCLHEVIDNAAWAVREHFMFRSFAQQNGQYSACAGGWYLVELNRWRTSC
jgi:hypothetical protein